MVTYIDANSAPMKNTGQIRLYGPEGFEGMRKASQLTARCLDELVSRRQTRRHHERTRRFRVRIRTWITAPCPRP
jgi:methionyl aminopeptidase